MKILLIVYDSAQFIHMFPAGLAYIASAINNAGHEVEIYNQDKYHYPEEHLLDYLDRNRFDVVGLSMVAGYYQYAKMQKISKAINMSRQRPFYILGGHGPAAEPEFFLKKMNADAVVIGEGELTIVELLENLSAQRTLRGIPGVAYIDNGKAIVNERRSLIEDIDSIPCPAYHLFPMHYYSMLRYANASPTEYIVTMLSGRGCKYKCNFCFRMDKGHRLRSNESIIEEIRFVKKEYGATYINFIDELLMASEERVVRLSEDFIKNNLNVKWACTGRLNYAKPDVLKSMRQAGCDFIDFGIEALDDKVLTTMRKGLTVKQIFRGVEAVQASGISAGLNMLFGHIGDKKENLQKAVEFLLKYTDGAQNRTIRPVTPYPGSPLYYHAIEKGLLNDVEDFYDNKHKNSDLLCVNFTDIPDEEFHSLLFDANSKLIKNYYSMQAKSDVECAKRLYIDGDASFRGFRKY
jgi:anaerobic magnesium-protoporphyrin IX monomethyl ester cyclase